MPSRNPFVSFAQNGEDVVLDRVLVGVEIGNYVEVGANHPTVDSVSRSFYDRGWSGIAVEPNPTFAATFRAARPRDRLIEAACTDSAEPTITLHLIEGTGLSSVIDSIGLDHAEQGHTVTDIVVPTIRLDVAISADVMSGEPIHFLLIDTEGAELFVLRSIDLTVVRPWIIVIEATAPGSTTQTHAAWEPLVLAAGYRFSLFDGLSRFYVAEEKWNELGEALSYPACVLDLYITAETLHLRESLENCERGQEASAIALAAARDDVITLRHTLSWRLTKPLRALRRLTGQR
jgi:FkbM family methyltransferase